MTIRVEIKIIVFVGLIFLTSCKSKYNIFSTYAKELKINSLVQKIEENYVNYNSLAVKFQIKYRSNNRKQLISGIYKIKKDSLIWITMGPAVGMEFFRAILTKDSVNFLNRFDKTYYIGDYKYINDFAKIEFLYANIENILSNQLPNSNNEDLVWRDYLSENYQYKISNNKYLLIKDKNFNENIGNSFFYNSLDTIIVLPDIYKIESLIWKDVKNNRQLKVSYKNYKLINNIYFPDEITIRIESYDNKQELDIKLRQINIDKREKYPFKIPKKKYSRIM